MSVCAAIQLCVEELCDLVGAVQPVSLHIRCVLDATGLKGRSGHGQLPQALPLGSSKDRVSREVPLASLEDFICAVDDERKRDGIDALGKMRRAPLIDAAEPMPGSGRAREEPDADEKERTRDDEAALTPTAGEGIVESDWLLVED
mmetsp:Transcript_45008/g.126797  ORF Transcript_45008/g.126797 Transcript_45008/m.126797 type:complete len:146 (+) Transcript_45008:124-561(+)